MPSNETLLQGSSGIGVHVSCQPVHYKYCKQQLCCDIVQDVPVRRRSTLQTRIVQVQVSLCLVHTRGLSRTCLPYDQVLIPLLWKDAVMFGRSTKTTLEDAENGFVNSRNKSTGIHVTYTRKKRRVSCVVSPKQYHNSKLRIASSMLLTCLAGLRQSLSRHRSAPEVGRAARCTG